MEHPLKVLNRYEVTEPAEVDMAGWFARYQEIIARSRGLRSLQEEHHG